MKTRYHLIRRGSRGGGFYCVDSDTGERSSLNPTNEEAAWQVVEATNQAVRQRFEIVGDSESGTACFQAMNFFREESLFALALEKPAKRFSLLR